MFDAVQASIAIYGARYSGFDFLGMTHSASCASAVLKANYFICEVLFSTALLRHSSNISTNASQRH